MLPAQIPDDADILPPSDDRIFKVLLTHPDATRVLSSVVSTVIERPVVSVQLLNTELPVTDTDEKAQRLDVNCIVDGGDQINVEMQSSPMEEEAGGGHENFTNKYVYYMAALHSSQKSKGVKYSKLARTYQITFCGHNVLPKHPDFVTRASLRRDTGEHISDQLNMIIVEMDKLRGIMDKPTETLTPLEMWAAFFQFAPKEEYRDFINKIIQIKEEIGMASALLMEISKNDHERALFLSRRKAETDLTSNLLTAEARGEARGRAEGQAKIALNMKKEGMPIDVIARLTQLAVQEIEKL